MTGRCTNSLARLLSADKQASLTAAGAVVFGCHLHEHDLPADKAGVLGLNPAAPGAEIAAYDAAVAAAKADVSLAFNLHSRPSSPKKIYLEFHGCVTEGTDGWNKYLELDSIVTPEYDSDGQPGFSRGELQEVFAVWQGVASHFSLWDVDVTTEDPGFEGLIRSDNEADAEYGIRVCVGGDGNWTGAHIGGIAVMNSFGWVHKPGGEVYRDSFVFSKNLITSEDRAVSANYIWKSISHEVGHTLGLAHKGVMLANSTKQEYYTIPPAPGLWAPVMGVPGRGLFVQWSNGSYPEAAGPPSNTDDDLAIISATLPLLQDEAGNTPATARMLCTQTECSPVPSNPSLITTAVRAVISGADDRDYYNVTADAQTAGPQRLKVVITYEPNWSKRSLALNGSEFSQNWRISNLRLQLQFVQQAVEVVAGPATEWSTQQQFDVTLPEAGAYTFWVEPTAQLSSNAQLPTTYGNVGTYRLTAIFATNSKATLLD
uniref:Uncharacterized protein n=1 Tax=Tetradesmus obliquus TaxID=3088 RepID=A0A383W0A8_TETOB|eukprot:jgi/Sobl393_1/19250/SZX70921.1